MRSWSYRATPLLRGVLQELDGEYRASTLRLGTL